jgi:DNA-binding transcriptional regulator YiaG
MTIPYQNTPDLVMTPQRYRELRESIGSRPAVAKHLGISNATLARRENSRKQVSKEAEIAIMNFDMCGLKLNKRNRNT